MKKIFFAQVLLLSSTFSFSQDINKIINVKEATRLEKKLAADEMQGRKAFSASIDKAADFIAGEFKKYGVLPFAGLTDHRQAFSMAKPTLIVAEGSINSNPVAPDNIIAITTKPELIVNENSGYTKLIFDSSASLMKDASRLVRAKQNYVVFVNSFHSKDFSKLKRFKRETFKTNNSIVFVLSDSIAKKFTFTVRHEIKESGLSNVVGMIPGKSKPDEYVIFSAHYDHLGIGKPNDDMDSVYNGANDDASGTTAIMMLANYFSKLNNNERTLIFVAFTAEELGGFGSTYFSTQINPDKVVAMFNIEMIGTESNWGTNSAYITGFEKSDFGAILQRNLKGSNFHFEPDPYPKQKLFYRSDNATLAQLGVPAHTISTSKMDSESFYHTPDDEIETLDIKNMTEIIKAIAISSNTIISGKDTPTRVVEN